MGLEPWSPWAEGFLGPCKALLQKEYLQRLLFSPPRPKGALTWHYLIQALWWYKGTSFHLGTGDFPLTSLLLLYGIRAVNRAFTSSCEASVLDPYSPLCYRIPDVPALCPQRAWQLSSQALPDPHQPNPSSWRLNVLTFWVPSYPWGSSRVWILTVKIFRAIH